MESLEQKLQKPEPFWRRFFRRKKVLETTTLPLTVDTLPIMEGEGRAEFPDARKIIRTGMLIVAIFFGGGGLWATLAKVSGAVIFQGVVKVEAERKVVQHLEGGIIKEILARNGDHVQKDRPLLVLESSKIEAAVDQLQAQIYSQMVSGARLTAEKDMASSISFPPELKNAQGGYVSDDIKALIDAETKVFNSQRTALQGQEDLTASQIEQIEEQINSLSERVKAEDSIIAALNEELEAKEVLYKDRFIDKSMILSLKRSKAENEGLRGQFLGAIAENREKIAAMKLQRVSLRNKYVEDATNKLADTGKLLLDLRDRLSPLEDARQRLTILAPMAGTVVGLNFHSVGGVLGPGQPILDIVPEGSPLVVEGKIQISDIAKVAKGQKADVQLLAFDTRTHPKVPGVVSYVSADRVVENTPMGPQSFYNVQVELDKDALASADLYLSPGMPAAVFVLTKARTVLDYALEPLLKSADMAMREN